jgi:diaminopimelate epimerase
LACGTGATTVAIAMNATGKTDATSIDLNVEGKLVVSFDKDDKYIMKGPLSLSLREQSRFKLTSNFNL